MKRVILFLTIISTFLFNKINAQTFNAISGVPVDLDLGSTNFTSCSSPGNKCNIQFNVSGVGTLSTTKALSKIDIQFDAGCGGNLRNVALFIKSPAGTCMRIYRGNSGTGMATNYTGLVSLSMRDGSCLNEPTVSNLGTTSITGATVSGNYGVFDANPGLDMATVFDSENADGTWTIYGFENTTDAPCVNSVSITFGDPTVGNQTANGEDCASAINWQGGPICVSTNGKSSSTLMPGSLSGGSSFGTIGGATCAWNSNNDNDAWIKFVPAASGLTCLSISGLDFDLQSIVVTDANADGDNDPCTYSGLFPNPPGNDPRWNIVSCPTSSNIYSNNGTALNQQHCFTANANQVYYLVVDGNGQVENDFYLSGTNGSFTPLSVDYLYFRGKNIGHENYLEWETSMEVNNAYFELEKSLNGTDFIKIATIPSKSINRQGAYYSYSDKDIKNGKNYYRIKQVDIDKNYSYSSLVKILNELNSKPQAIADNNHLYFTNINKDRQINISIIDLSGKVVYQQKNDNPIATSGFSKSIYFVRIENGGASQIQKVIFR